MNIKPYRPNVSAIILHPNYPDDKRIFIAKRTDLKDVWQFPQGGIDRGETPQEALLRELKEEIGTSKVKIISEYPDWIAYDYPPNNIKKLLPYMGQTQKYFLVKLKKSAKINLDTKHPEFNEYKFIKASKFLKEVNNFKKPIYEKVIRYFKNQDLL